MSDEKKFDAVQRPAHYNAGGVECIDALAAATINLTGIDAVCTANAIKYLWRWKMKNGTEDLQKALWYINRLLKEHTTAVPLVAVPPAVVTPDAAELLRMAIDAANLRRALSHMREHVLRYWPEWAESEQCSEVRGLLIGYQPPAASQQTQSPEWFGSTKYIPFAIQMTRMNQRALSWANWFGARFVPGATSAGSTSFIGRGRPTLSLSPGQSASRNASHDAGGAAVLSMA